MRSAIEKEPKNYWYYFYLAFVEDQSGLSEEALKNYSIAMALNPTSPWVRFSRARIYRSKGLWSQAIHDMQTALEELAGQSEARKVHLELGYLHSELGDFERARREFDLVTESDDGDSYARAARLDRANMDAESGAVERALAEYDALLALDFNDVVARHSRAILAMRMGQPDRAEKDLSVLLEKGESLKNPGEILAERARARLLSGRIPAAIADAGGARRVHPCPAHDRLWQRVLLAAHRFDRDPARASRGRGPAPTGRPEVDRRSPGRGDRTRPPIIRRR